jgi:hypothetical protein
VRVYTYVIVNDAGSAPSFERPMASLAVCKPRIRIAAEVGDLVLAFAGKTLGPEPHAVRWAGVVAETLTFAEYWRRSRRARRPRPPAPIDELPDFGGDLLDSVDEGPAPATRLRWRARASRHVQSHDA